MRRIAGLVGSVVLGVAALVVSPVGAGAVVTTNCTDFLAPGIYGTVVVPAGATCFSDGGVTIRNGLYIQQGATLVIGSEESGHNIGTILGGVHASNAKNVQIHFMTILDGVDIQGGSGPFGAPFDVTWNTIEDSYIRGPVTVNGYNGFWMGFIRNKVAGNVTMTNNHLTDEDANEYVTNVISGNLSCSGNSPAPQICDSEGTHNIVTGSKLGQCAGV
jgi:hypothetical protein